MKEKISICALALVLLNQHSFSQIIFQQAIGGVANDHSTSIQQTNDGGFVFVGTTLSFGSGGAEIYLSKIDSLGGNQWTKTFGGALSKYGNDVKQTTDGGYILTGWTQSFGPGGDDVYVVRTNSGGDTLWTREYGGVSYDAGWSIQECIEGGYIIAGETSSFGAGLSDVYLLRIDSLGQILWSKTYGGGSDDYGIEVKQTNDSGFVIVGNTNSFGTGFGDIYVLRTDYNGNLSWTRTFSNFIQFNATTDYGNSIQQTIDGGFIIGGTSTWGISPTFDIFLIKLNAGGDTLWTKSFSNSSVGSILQTADGGYVIGGGRLLDAYLLKTDVNGDTLWSRTYGGGSGDGALHVEQVSDAGYILSGTTQSYGAGLQDIYLIKTDSNGNGGCNTYTLPITLGNTQPIVDSGGVVGSGSLNMSTATTVNTLSSVIDTTLCSSTTVTINVGTNSSNASCYGDCNGTATVNPSGGTPPYQFIWNDSLNQTSQIATGLCAGTYTVIVTDSTGQMDSSSTTVNQPPLNTNSLTAEICSDDSMLLGGTYQNLAGTYYDTLISNAGCDSIRSMNLIVNPLPTVSFTGLDSTYCSADAGVAMTGTPLNGAFGGTGGVAGNIFYPATWVGTYLVTYSYTDTFGCSNSYSQAVNVVQCTEVVDYKRAFQIKIHPNPNTGQFTVNMSFTKDTETSIKVFEFTGRMVYSEKTANITGSFTKQVDLSDYSKGIYFLQVSTKSGILTRKVVLY